MRERVGEISRHVDLTRGSARLDVNLDLLTGGDSGRGRFSALSGTENRPPITATVVR